MNKNSWDLTQIYQEEKDFEAAFASCEKGLNDIAAYAGHISKDNLLTFLKASDEAEMLLSRLYVYASMSYDRNQKDASGQARYGKIMGLFSRYIQATSFGPSEILALGKDTLMALSELPEYADYKYLLTKLVRNQSHVKSVVEEKIMANYAPVVNNFATLYDMAAVADGVDGEVTLSDGSTHKINHSNFRSFLETLESQDDRRLVFESIFKPFRDRRNTFASIYNGLVQSNIAEMKNRGYSSILASFLENNAIPESVYLSLLNSVKSNSAIVKDYYQLKKKIFNLDTIHTYDRFKKFASSSKKYSYEEGKSLFYESIKSIGGDFEAKAHAVLEEGRVDVYHSDGKRTGAYSTGIYEIGPFILLNYDNTLSDVFTLAHEAGHSIHTMLASENNGYSNSNYTIFVAEIASTFNEQILLDHLISQDLDHDSRLFLIQSSIDDLIGTFYRQTLFADYEYRAHNLALTNQPINADSLEKLMTDLYMEYYGIDLNEEPYKNDVWGYIPHLYHSPFYVYQYATCFACSLAIYDRVKKGEEGALDRYFDMLKAGGSDFPINIVKLGGVDLTTPEPFEAVFKRLSYLIGELKKELN